MKTLWTLNTKQLNELKRTLEHAKANRQGGLLVGEQKALDAINQELQDRKEIEQLQATCPQS
jgi:hypothetical protein